MEDLETFESGGMLDISSEMTELSQVSNIFCLIYYLTLLLKH